MGVSTCSAPRMPSARQRAIVWHDLECGSYRADLPLWRELALELQGPVLEIGAGTGRVALDLAARGHEVTALERDTDLVWALRARAAGERVRVVCADARDFSLARRDFALCVVAMQTIQLLGGAPGRSAFLRCVRAHLRPGGLVACAILSAVEPFDCGLGELGPSPETMWRDGLRYVSRPTRVRVGTRGVEIEREREIGAGAEIARERSREQLDRVSARALEREGAAAGLRAMAGREVPATEDHVGSRVVVLGG